MQHFERVFFAKICVSDLPKCVHVAVSTAGTAKFNWIAHQFSGSVFEGLLDRIPAGLLLPTAIEADAIVLYGELVSNVIFILHLVHQ